MAIFWQLIFSKLIELLISSKFLAKLFNHSAFLLIFHGSSNPNYLSSPLKLATLIRAILSEQYLDIPEPNSVSPQQDQEIFTRYNHLRVPLVDVAVLECADVPLSQRIIESAQQAIHHNYQQLILVPVFLSAGVHVLEDIPEELSQAKHFLGSAIEVKLTDYVGNFPHMQNLIANKFKKFASSGKIILAHGSRLSKGNVAVENLAKAVAANNAYWTIEPDLFKMINLLIEQGKTSIVIVPYFLFIGRITDIISSQVSEMQKEFPQNELLLDSPLGASRELARLITSQIEQYLQPY